MGVSGGRQFPFLLFASYRDSRGVELAARVLNVHETCLLYCKVCGVRANQWEATVASSTLALALATPRPTNHACLHRGHPLIWVLLPVEFFDLRRLKESHVTAAAALLAHAAHPFVIADAAAAAVLAPAALPPVLA